ncbi:ADAMTS-like protein 3 [Armadillidium vulgare]|nr:ADAMTS-like protein 3 [Armadillidium vulgare]
MTADYCNYLPKPKLKTSVCNRFSCDVRWIAGHWEHCTRTCGSNGIQFRLVSCARRQLYSSNDNQDFYTPKNQLPYKAFKNMSTLLEDEIFWQGQRFKNVNSNREEQEVTEYYYVDPSFCDAKLKPVSERPCNRVTCKVDWKEIGWSECSVTCGMGKQELILVCRRENEVDIINSREICGEKPREFRACYPADCPESRHCKKDQSVFCRLPSLYRYCKIPKYYEMCCETCRVISSSS